MLRIIADDKIPFLKGVLEPYCKVIYIPGKHISSTDIRRADALLIRTRTKCTESLLEGSGVKFIGTATIGFDHIDIHYCEKHDIHWINSPGCNSSSVQQYIAASLLKVAAASNFKLKDKTIGIIGVGNVGSKVEKLARILGMNVLLNDPPRSRLEGKTDFVNFGTLLAESDIVTVHVPLSFVGEYKTYQLFNERSFNKLKKGTWFFNTSRGEVTDTSSLKKALETGRLGGVVLDVWENEPDIDKELLEKSLIATPHIAGYSTDGKANGTAMVVNSLSNYFNLPLDNWFPDNIPQPLENELIIDGKGKSDEDVVREAVIHTYNPEEDDSKLRLSPSEFELLRGEYPLRREFSSFKIKLKDSTPGAKKMLNSLGFKVEKIIT